VHELFELIQELTENEFVLTCTYSAFVSEIATVELAIVMFMAIEACIRLQYGGYRMMVVIFNEVVLITSAWHRVQEGTATLNANLIGLFMNTCGSSLVLHSQ
jgi:hypothetical protein